MFRVNDCCKPRFQSFDAIADPDSMLDIVLGQKFADPIVMSLHSDNVPIGLYERSVSFSFIAVFDGCWTIDWRMAGEVASRRLWFLTTPMLDDLAILKTEQVECDQRCRCVFEAFVHRVHEDPLAINESSVNCYVGGRRRRQCRHQCFHPGQPVGHIGVMLDERLGEVAIDDRHVFFAENIDEDLLRSFA